MSRPRAGFTLLEVTVTIAILAMMLSFVYQMLSNTVNFSGDMAEEVEGPKIETAILDELIRDLRFVYFRPGQLKGNAGFWGREKIINGVRADRLDFLTCRRSRRAELPGADQAQVNAPLIEVGYACRPSEVYDRHLELWRREDYFVDDDPTNGGKYDLVYDRLRSFELTYYLPTDQRDDTDKGLQEWNTTVQNKLPYAIVLRMTYDVKPPQPAERGRAPRDTPAASVRRIILLKPALSEPPDAGMDAAMAGMR